MGLNETSASDGAAHIGAGCNACMSERFVRPERFVRKDMLPAERIKHYST